jgi:predicted ATP-grasp superfamily ATP-dependent carboligase
MSSVDQVVAIQRDHVSSNASRERTNKVLLLGNDDRVILAVIRSLGRRGVRVHVAWCDRATPALRSRYVAEVHSIPAYSKDSNDWVDSLNALVREHDYDLVMPCNDFAVVPLQLERDKLEPNTHWYLINEEAYDIAFDKSRTSQLAQQMGIPVPTEFLLSRQQTQSLARLTSVSEIERRQLRFPVFVKPRSSITQDDLEHKRSVQKVKSAADLARVLRRSTDVDGLLIQECFEGEGVGVEVLAKDGRIVMDLQHRRLRETIDGGSTYRETMPRNDDLVDAVAKLLCHLNYSGVAMFEFRHNPNTGDWVLLEINARFWGSLPLAIAAGVDFPFCLYSMLVSGQESFSSEYKPGVRCRHLVADLRAFKQQRRSGELLGQRFQWSRLLLGRDHLDHLAADDWKPQLFSLWQFASTLVRKFCSASSQFFAPRGN